MTIAGPTVHDGDIGRGSAAIGCGLTLPAAKFDAVGRFVGGRPRLRGGDRLRALRLRLLLRCLEESGAADALLPVQAWRE